MYHSKHYLRTIVLTLLFILSIKYFTKTLSIIRKKKPLKSGKKYYLFKAQDIFS